MRELDNHISALLTNAQDAGAAIRPQLEIWHRHTLLERLLQAVKITK